MILSVTQGPTIWVPGLPGLYRIHEEPWTIIIVSISQQNNTVLARGIAGNDPEILAEAHAPVSSRAMGLGSSALWFRVRGNEDFLRSTGTSGHMGVIRLFYSPYEEFQRVN